MKLNIETFVKEYLKKSVDDLACQPTSGIACAVASTRYIRDEMLKEVSEDDKVIVTDFFNGKDGLIAQMISAKTLNGFCSNASAAAKAAGLSTTSTSASSLLE